jgi:predicted SprT family Zn-dependent metalloprotease
MTVKLTPELLEWAYELVTHTDPFLKWNLPDGHHVDFRVTKSNKTIGDYLMEGDKHVIRVSSKCVATLQKLIEVMAHETLHLHISHNRFAPREGHHGKTFRLLANRICKIHGFDPMAF